MAVNLGHLRSWIQRKYAIVLSRLVSSNGWLSKGFYRIFSWLWEKVSHSKVFRIVSFAEYLSKHKGKAITIETNRKGYVANAVSFGKGVKQQLKEVKLPDLTLYRLDNVSIHHGSDFIANVKERLLVNDYCANKNDNNKGYEDRWCYWQVGKVAITRMYKEGKHLEAGIMLLDKYSFNYYHNVFENLIRLCVLEECNDLIPYDVPIVIDEEIYKVSSFKRIFEILTERMEREVVIVKKNELVAIDSLYYITPVNSLVPNHKDYTKGRIDDYIFSREYTVSMRNKLLAHKDEKVKFPKRVFITRKNTTKRNFNEEELFAELKPYGFQMVAPEEYSFEEQMALFNNAEWIVGGAGAALTNLLFLHQSSIVICLVAKADYIPPVFTAPVCFNESKLYYLQSSLGDYSKDPHSSFSFNVADFHQFVNECAEFL